MTSCSVATLACLSFSTLADEASDVSLPLFKSGWFSKGGAIQDLRERSTRTFELLDENDSGSITLDEIDLTTMESEMSEMSQEDLRDHGRRTSAIHSRFFSWSSEIDEFEVVDTNNDGVWNKEEYEERGTNIQSHRLELGFQEWDTDGNDAIELHEFNSHLDELELLDENADGIVSHEEALKGDNQRVISDVLMNTLLLDETIWTNISGEHASKGVFLHNMEIKTEVKRKSL